MENKQEAKYIERIEIKGLWGRYDVDWKLNPDVNILLGENGTGKSTILRGIERIESSRMMSKNISYGFDFSENIFLSTLKLNLEGSNEAIVLLQGQFDEINKIQNSSIGGLLNELPKIDYISTFDKTLYEKNDWDKKNKPFIKTHLDKELDGIIDKYVEYQLNQNKKLRNNGKKYEEVFAKQRYLIDTLNRLFLITEKRVDEEENRLSFLLREGTKIPPYELSSGEKQLLIVLLTVLCQDEKPYILLMDEPEISLHLRWQYELVEIIRTLNPNCQLIIVTHSPSIFGKGWRDKLFFIDTIVHPSKKEEVA